MLWGKKKTEEKEKKSDIVHPSQVATKSTGEKRFSFKSPAHSYDNRWAHLSAAGPAVRARKRACTRSPRVNKH